MAVTMVTVMVNERLTRSHIASCNAIGYFHCRAWLPVSQPCHLYVTNGLIGGLFKWCVSSYINVSAYVLSACTKINDLTWHEYCEETVATTVFSFVIGEIKQCTWYSGISFFLRRWVNGTLGGKERIPCKTIMIAFWRSCFKGWF